MERDKRDLASTFKKQFPESSQKEKSYLKKY